ncbi:hypothetical protein B0T21DRAFT_160476 [Apiosordaria backusii]|uniref:Uncharacterized protein n=1 Tax=Apiosordaria backusii TaxID=314023 RepID=A0AA40EGU2_9PEZI|nr:hypothetical protein B0T21DRAFT_160476 [Apiosordaria backusii]
MVLWSRWGFAVAMHFVARFSKNGEIGSGGAPAVLCTKNGVILLSLSWTSPLPEDLVAGKVAPVSDARDISIAVRPLKPPSNPCSLEIWREECCFLGGHRHNNHASTFTSRFPQEADAHMYFGRWSSRFLASPGPSVALNTDHFPGVGRDRRGEHHVIRWSHQLVTRVTNPIFTHGSGFGVTTLLSCSWRTVSDLVGQLYTN